MNVSGDGTVWGLNSTQFIREKMLGSGAFYSLEIGVNDAFSKYTLGVCIYRPDMYGLLQPVYFCVHGRCGVVVIYVVGSTTVYAFAD